jgi:hypothetical protein
VFFDSLGVDWRYEHEGFELESGRYLPDFYLPKLETWVEIKPSPDIAKAECAEARCMELAGATGKRVILFDREVGFWVGKQDHLEGVGDSGQAFWGVGNGDCCYWPCICPKCGRMGIEYNGRGNRVCGAACLGADYDSGKDYTGDHAGVVAAVDQARSWGFWDPPRAAPQQGISP